MEFFFLRWVIAYILATTSGIATEKSWSAYNIQITPVSINTQSRDNGTSTLPHIKSTIVFDLFGVEYFIRPFPDVINAYPAIFSNH